MVRRETPISDFIENLAEPEPWPPHPELREAVAEAVDNLPQDLRDVVEAVVYERLSYRKAAVRLGYAAHSQVFYKLREAFQILREELKHLYEDD